MSDVEIIELTGFSRFYVGNISTNYWKSKMKITDTNNEMLMLRVKFNNAFNLPICYEPSLIKTQRFELHEELMQEELDEYSEACRNKDLVEIADALTDMQEILLGMFAEHGMLHLHQELYKEVHLSNMSKLDSNGKPVYREDGKVMKGSNYKKPNISNVLGV